VYQQLRELAARRMANERTGHTLQPTALVHEAYVRLLGQRKRWNNSGEFYLAAAEAMRRILIDHARANGSQKRGGRQHRLPLNSLLELAGSDRFEEILSLDELILRLEKVSASAAQVVRLRFFAGLSTQEAADALGVSVRTLQREWNFARAWLARELDDG
jgi:RNA polymerase sigma factor (TIGR02999 family)